MDNETKILGWKIVETETQFDKDVETGTYWDWEIF